MASDFWDKKWADSSSLLHVPARRSPVRSVVDGLECTHSMTLLDIGCGAGAYEKSLSGQVGTVVACDISREAVICAKRTVPDNVELVQTGGEGLGFLRSCSVDVVFSYSVFQHISGSLVKKYLSESLRVLRIGGHLRFQVFERKRLFRQGVVQVLKGRRFRTSAGMIIQATLLWRDNQRLSSLSWPLGKPWSRQELSTILAHLGFTHIDFDSLEDGELVCTARRS